MYFIGLPPEEDIAKILLFVHLIILSFISKRSSTKSIESEIILDIYFTYGVYASEIL